MKIYFHLKGFTLMELMVVIVIIGIIASLAVPTYINTREKALDKEAVAGLALIRNGNRQYYARQGFFWPSAGFDNNITEINGNLSIELSSVLWNYTVTYTGINTFRATATRRGRTWTVTNVTGTPPACSPAAACL